MPASMCSHVHEYGATVCISFSRYRLRTICIITTENELIFTTSPHVDIELWLGFALGAWVVHVHGFVMRMYMCGLCAF